MTGLIVKIVLAILAVVGAYFGGSRYGKVKQEKNTAESNSNVMAEHAKIDSSPDPDDPADDL
jgi:hypothetical protein